MDELEEGAPDGAVRLPSEVAENTGYLLSRLGLRARRLFSESIVELGIRPPHFGVLALLGEAGPLAQSEVAEGLSVDPGWLVGLLDELEREGLVVREADPRDRRRHAVRLTVEGEARMREARRRAAGTERALLERLEPRERDELRRLLKRLAMQ